MSRLDEILQRLQNQPSWNVPRFDVVGTDGENVVPIPWYEVEGSIVYAVAIRAADLDTQIEELTAQIQFWGRAEGICERALEWHLRQYRSWKGGQTLRIKSPPVGVDLKGWKKPTDKEVEGIYRNLPEYVEMKNRIDVARESLTATKYVREAFQVKAKLVAQYVRRSIDDGRPRLAVGE